MKKMSEKVFRNGENLGFLVPAKVLPGTPGSLALEEMPKCRQRRQLGVYWPVAERHNGNPVYIDYEQRLVLDR